MTARRDADLDHIESAVGKLVYLYLETRGEATVEELRDDLDLSQLKLYPVLRTLSDRGLIEASGGTYQPTSQVRASAT